MTRCFIQKSSLIYFYFPETNWSVPSFFTKRKALAKKKFSTNLLSINIKCYCLLELSCASSYFPAFLTDQMCPRSVLSWDETQSQAWNLGYELGNSPPPPAPAHAFVEVATTISHSDWWDLLFMTLKKIIVLLNSTFWFNKDLFTLLIANGEILSTVRCNRNRQ